MAQTKGQPVVVRMLAVLEQRRYLVLAGMLALYTLVLFFGLTFKYVFWGQGYDQIDYQQSIWNTTQGRFLEISHYRHTDSLWGMDFIPAILLIVPFYALVPSALTLNFFQAFLMALGALPVYGAARDRFGGSRLAGLGWAAVYLLYPSLWFVTMSAPWQPRTLAIPALLGAFYFLQRAYLARNNTILAPEVTGNRPWRMFLACLAIALTTRTDASLVVIAFGLLAGVWRMGWRWALPPILIGMAWFYLSTAYIVPAFYRPDYQPQSGQIGEGYDRTWPGKSPQLAYYSHLGNSLREIVTYIITHPVEVFQLVFTQQKIYYLFLMLLPLLLLPLLAPDAALPAAPILAMNLLSTRMFQITIREQYQALVIPGLIIAAIVGGARLWEWWQKRSAARNIPVAQAVMLALVGYALVINLALKNPVATTILYHEDPARIATMERMAALVPVDAPLGASSFLAARMMPRQYIYYLPNSPSFPPLERAAYLFIDERASALENKAFIAQVRASPEWRVLAEQDDLLLLQRVSP